MAHIIQSNLVEGVQQLPYEEIVEAPEELKASFNKIITAVPIDVDGDGSYDEVQIDGDIIPRTQWEEDNFNDLGKKIPRDNSHRVSLNADLIEKFNTYNYDGSGIGKILGYFLSFSSLGIYALIKRKTVPAGHFGHYESDGRHMLTRDGIHTIISSTEKWLPPIPIDTEQDNGQLMRTFGDKTILQVPENHIAGAFKIGGKNEFDTEDNIMRRDGEFVLFGQGRHVLSDSEYASVVVKKLETDKLVVGPVTVLYVKKNWLGGAYERKKGTYIVFYPGPPYILHEQDYESISLVERTEDNFNLGPFQFITVKDGQKVGAFLKQGGQYQILPPGFSYQLHQSLYEKANVVPRSDQYELGPYYFMTVRNEFVAGVSKKKDGRFMMLPPGNTYQLNKEDYLKPVMKKKDSYKITLGPLTILTVPMNKLAGAYRTSDSQFIEFSGSESSQQDPFILHEEEYYGLTVIDKYSDKLQNFGPNIVITIPGGFCGIFEKKGEIDIRDKGFHKLSAEFSLKELVPLKVYTLNMSKVDFKTKDGISMGISFSVTWKVVDPQQVAYFAGQFRDLQMLVQDRSLKNMIKICKAYNRGDLLPTQQDIMVSVDMTDDADIQQLYKDAHERTKQLYKELEATCNSILTTTSDASALGISVISVHIDNFELLDKNIIRDLENITASLLATKEAKVKGELGVAQVEAGKKEAEKKAEVEAFIKIKQAEANANVREKEAISEANVKLTQAKAENDARVQIETAKAKAEAEAVKIKLESDRARAQMEAEVAAVKIETETNKIMKEAQAKAAAIKLLADAEYERETKALEAKSKMTPGELMLQAMDREVQGLEAFGNAAWKHPEPYQHVFEKFSDKFRMGHMTVEELMTRVGLPAEHINRNMPENMQRNAIDNAQD